MNKYLISLILIISLTSFSSSSRKVKVFIAGDSTAQTYREERDGLIKGWGQMLPDFFNENVEVGNHAIGGWSTKTFLNEGRWDRLISDVREGDYVFIQFGHNDASKRPERYASLADYKSNLTKMIQDVRDKKATPVLLTSVVMRTFVNGNLVDDRLKGYPAVMRILAKEMNVLLIDINQKTKDFVTVLGDKASIPYYRWVEPGVDKAKPEGLKDDTHMMEKGAKQVAYFVAESIKELNLKGLCEYLKPLDPSYSINSMLPRGRQVYLFSYFKGNGDGLHLAYSYDGLKWEALRNDSIILKPEIGKNKLMRDQVLYKTKTVYFIWFGHPAGGIRG